MLIIEIHADTIENANSANAETAPAKHATAKLAAPSTRTQREEERPERASELSNTTGNRFWKALKHRVPGYLIQYHKAEK